jgi:RHS repeat-associated protein
MAEQASASYTEILYSPTGDKVALMNGQSLRNAFIPLPGGAQAVYGSTGVLSYYRHPDWLGSSRLATTSTRTVYYDGAYAPFGENYNETGTHDRSFTGQTQGTAYGIYDFLFRQQNPVHGRWLVPDPAGLAAVDLINPQTWNRYAYVANNPLNRVDPLGLMMCQVRCPNWGGEWGGWGSGSDLFWLGVGSSDMDSGGSFLRGILGDGGGGGGSDGGGGFPDIFTIPSFLPQGLCIGPVCISGNINDGGIWGNIFNGVVNGDWSGITGPIPGIDTPAFDANRESNKSPDPILQYDKCATQVRNQAAKNRQTITLLQAVSLGNAVAGCAFTGPGYLACLSTLGNLNLAVTVVNWTGYEVSVWNGEAKCMQNN